MSGRFTKTTLCMLLVTILLILLNGVSGGAEEVVRVSIPSDAVTYNGHAYKLYDIGCKWTEAQAQCEKLGGHLVTVTSRKEHNFLKKMCGDRINRYCWIGGYKSGGKWKWITGESWGYTAWSDGQPNDSGGGGYALMENWKDIDSPWTWDDQNDTGISPYSNWTSAPYYQITSSYFYICEWEYISVSKPTKLEASQPKSNQVKLTWKAGENAKGYFIYRAEGDGAFEQIGSTKKLNYTDKKVKNGKAYKYKVQSINGTSTATSSVVKAYPMDKPKGLKAKLIESDTKVQLSWKAVTGAQEYWIYQKSPGESNFKKKATTADNKVTVLIDASKGSYQYYVAPAVKSFRGLQSATVDVNPVVYRAVVIGQTYINWDDHQLPGCAHDMIAMEGVLSNLTSTKYAKIKPIINGTKSEILTGIENIFSLADENDVSLFFYSGHGCDDRFLFFTGDNHGALVGRDKKCITPKQLRKKMDQYKGKKVIILSSCHSGQMIGKNTDELAALKQINSSFISAFSAGNPRDGELARDGYYVITCCSKSELGWSTPNGSLFPIFFVQGLGWDLIDGQSISLLADTNNDSQVTLNEAYLYSRGQLDGYPINHDGSTYYMHVQVYPENCSEVFFAR